MPISTQSTAALLFFLCSGLGASASNLQESPPSLVPAPVERHDEPGELPVMAGLEVSLQGAPDPRVPEALERMLVSWSRHSRISFTSQTVAADRAFLALTWDRVVADSPCLGEDESYQLTLADGRVTLHAPTSTGILRGLSTLTLLLHDAGGRWALPMAVIRDRPRFPWRGLLLDVVRHWLPPDSVRRQLDAMALVKLNVLHLHLTDDQGFRIESRRHPELHTLASDGHFYSQAEMSDLVAYARSLGIRVVPEFDLPAHATSWLVSHPELASAPGRYALARRWDNVINVVDPTNEGLYGLLGDFLDEMAALFPDACVHLGGDEDDAVQWAANPRIQRFIRDRNLKDNDGLQTFMSQRLAELLRARGRRPVAWDDALHDGLPKDFIVQTWHDDGTQAALASGYSVVTSTGFYLSVSLQPVDLYRRDPVPRESGLGPERLSQILGGEAALWTEWVTSDTVDNRVWPQAAAVAERLWSPRECRDEPDFERRLAAVLPWLEGTGLHREGWPAIPPKGIRFAGPDLRRWRDFVGALSPVPTSERGQLQPDIDQTVPLNDLADWVCPYNPRPAEFAAELDRWLAAAGPLDPGAGARLRRQLCVWQEAAQWAALAPADDAPRALGRTRTAHDLAAACQAAIEAIDSLLAARPPAGPWSEAAHRALSAAVPNAAAVRISFLPELDRLVSAAADPARRTATTRP